MHLHTRKGPRNMNTTTFGRLSIGDQFKYESSLYIKLSAILAQDVMGYEHPFYVGDEVYIGDEM